MQLLRKYFATIYVALVGHGQEPHARPCLKAQNKAARGVSNGSRAKATEITLPPKLQMLLNNAS